MRYFTKVSVVEMGIASSLLTQKNLSCLISQITAAELAGNNQEMKCSFSVVEQLKDCFLVIASCASKDLLS